MIKAGILSDTHLTTTTEVFKQLAKLAFTDCNVIFHAGDITSVEILDVFKDKTVHAVHGNMCSLSTRQFFSSKKLIDFGSFTIGLCHGTGSYHNIEDRMWTQFPDVDCIIYGHTHQPTIDQRGGILFINPGSFQCRSHYGSPASYATLEVDDAGLHAKLHTVSANPA